MNCEEYDELSWVKSFICTPTEVVKWQTEQGRVGQGQGRLTLRVKRFFARSTGWQILINLVAALNVSAAHLYLGRVS